jgi:glycosyltransferase involved in cell wall biosynthesis
VLAVSESTRQDVIALCGVPAERVVTVPNGVTEEFHPGNPTAAAEFRQCRGLPERFLLYLGTLEPRKNLVRLVEAYARWRSTSPGVQLRGNIRLGPVSDRAVPLRGNKGNRGSPPLKEGPAEVKLVIAGAKGWYYEQIFDRVTELGLGDDVIFPGFVPGDELPRWYQAAEAFVYPSLFEGFGLPVLEALACGTPVVTSAASSLPDVAGEAAVLVNPEDTDALAAAIGQVLDDPVLRTRLAAAGPRQAARFSWSHTAAETSEVYRSVLADPKGLSKSFDRGSSGRRVFR